MTTAQPPPTRTVRVLKLVDEAPGVKSLYLSYEKKDISYRAGQSFRLYVDPDISKNLFHPFSIASSPTEDYLLFTTRIREESPFKQTFRKLQPGDELTIMGPGPSGLSLPDDSPGEVVFLGGGIGITPFRSMAKYATDTGLTHKITLLYSSKTAEDIVFRDEWNEIQERNPNLKVVYTVTRPHEDNPNWKGRIGRIDSDFILQNVKEPNKAYFYVCGPPALIGGLGGVLESLKVESQRIQIESFRGYG